MKKIILACLSFSATAFAQGVAAPVESPKKSDERIILHTIAGDIVAALYPELAPATTRQILNLVRLGVYDGIHFYRLEDNFVAQTSTAYDRVPALTPEQRAAIHPIPAEFGAVRHRRGILSMAREDGKIDSAETSFSILMTDAPHLDHQYTVFGEVEQGMDVVDAMFRVPKKTGTTQPIMRVELTRAEVVAHEADLQKMKLIPAHEIVVPAAIIQAQILEAQAAHAGPPLALILALATSALLGVVTFLISHRVPARVVSGLVLINVLVSSFFLYICLIPLGQQRQWLAAILFVALLALIKLLGRFENPVAQPSTQAK